ncbi:MAG: polyprenol monophosphomannose synthase [Actinomycetota bacterium]
MRVLIVTPTYLEAENIEIFLEQTRASVPDADILVVDDSSADGTADLAEKAGADLGRIDVLRRPRKIGLGDAYRAGFSVGIQRGYDLLVQIDADLSHDPAALPAMLRAVENGADMAIGSRYIPGGAIPNWPWLRRALSKWGNRYTNAVLGMPIRDATSGYRVYRAETLRAIDYGSTRAKGYGFQIELAYRVWRNGGHIEQLPIVFTDRVRGESKMTWQVAMEELTLVTWWGLRDRVLRRGSRTGTPAPPCA